VRRILVPLAVLVVGAAMAGLLVSVLRSDEPGRLACPLTGAVGCGDGACPLGACERAARRLRERLVGPSGLSRRSVPLTASTDLPHGPSRN